MSKKSKKADTSVKTVKTKKEKRAKTDKKEKIFGSPVRNLLITALVSILLGVAFLVKPTLVYSYCGYAIGGLIGLVGIIYIIIYFFRKPVSGEYRYEFGVGLVALLAGAYVALGGILIGSVSSVGIGFEIIIKLIGILIAADGILKLQYTLDIARMKYPRWWIGLILSVLGIALGVVTVMGFTYDMGDFLGIGKSAYLNATQNAFVGGMMALGIAFCINGALDLCAMILILVRNRKARREEVIAEGTALVAAAKQEELDSSLPVAEVPAAPVEESVYVPAPAPVQEGIPVPEAPVPEPVPEEIPAPVVEEPVQAAPAEEA